MRLYESDIQLMQKCYDVLPAEMKQHMDKVATTHGLTLRTSPRALHSIHSISAASAVFLMKMMNIAGLMVSIAAPYLSESEVKRLRCCLWQHTPAVLKYKKIRLCRHRLCLFCRTRVLSQMLKEIKEMNPEYVHVGEAVLPLGIPYKKKRGAYAYAPVRRHEDSTVTIKGVHSSPGCDKLVVKLSSLIPEGAYTPDADDPLKEPAVLAASVNLPDVVFEHLRYDFAICSSPELMKSWLDMTKGMQWVYHKNGVKREERSPEEDAEDTAVGSEPEVRVT